MAYQAPELFTTEERPRLPAVMASDIWAFGATLYEITTGDPPFGDQGGLYQIMQMQGHFQSNSGITDLPLPSRYSGMLQTLIGDCLAPSTWDRPRAKELVAEARRQLEGTQAQKPEHEPSPVAPTHRERPPVLEKRDTPYVLTSAGQGMRKLLLPLASLLAGGLLSYWIFVIQPFSGQNNQVDTNSKSDDIDTVITSEATDTISVYGGVPISSSENTKPSYNPHDFSKQELLPSASQSIQDIKKNELRDLLNEKSQRKDSRGGICLDKLNAIKRELDLNGYDSACQLICDKGDQKTCGTPELQNVCDCSIGGARNSKILH